jgi:hypothetical protein
VIHPGREASGIQHFTVVGSGDEVAPEDDPSSLLNFDVPLRWFFRKTSLVHLAARAPLAMVVALVTDLGVGDLVDVAAIETCAVARAL